MKRSLLLTLAGLLVLLAAGPTAQQDAEKSEIKEAIDAGYLNAYWNDMNMKALLTYWDHGAISMGLVDDQMQFTSLINWFSGMSRRKAPEKKEYTFLYPAIDVTGNMAMAKVEVMKGDQIQFTDYFPLFKTKSGWRIVAYPFYQHQDGLRPPVPEGEAAAVTKTVEDAIVHGLIENGNKEQVMAGIGEVCDLNRYVPEFDEITKQNLGMVLLARSRGAVALPVTKWDFSLIGITGYLAAGKLHVDFTEKHAINMYLALYKTAAGWKIVELTSDVPLGVLAQRPPRKAGRGGGDTSRSEPTIAGTESKR